MVREHGVERPSQWAAIGSIAVKIGCTSETLRHWVRQAERDAGRGPGMRYENVVVFGVTAAMWPVDCS